MPSLRPDVSAWQPTEAWLLPGLTVALGFILVESIGMGVDAAVFPILIGIGCPLALLLALLARRWGSHCLHMAVFMGVLGGIGMLIGARIDFGPFGLVTLTGWCSALPALSLDAVWTRVGLAPWTYAGMLVACNLGMALSLLLFASPPAGRPAPVLLYLACNGGMILGMLLAEFVMADLAFGIVATTPAPTMLLLMVCGMTLGMWAGWWCAQWLLRGCRRPAWKIRLSGM